MSLVGLGPWVCGVRTATLVRGCNTAGRFRFADRYTAADLASGTPWLIKMNKVGFYFSFLESWNLLGPRKGVRGYDAYLSDCDMRSDCRCATQ